MELSIPPVLSRPQAQRSLSGKTNLTWAEQALLLEEWALQMFFGHCCPLED